MRHLIAVVALLGLCTAIAAADDAPPADDQGQGVKAEEQDCTKLEGEEKTKCEEAKAATPEDKAATPEDKKGGKQMEKSNDNRMESMDVDE